MDDYIRANRDRYTREATTRQLEAAGHDPAEIAAAWERLDAGPMTAGRASGAATATGARVAAALLAGFGVLLLLNA